MKIQEMLRTILTSSPVCGKYLTPDLFRQAKADSRTGIAISDDGERQLYLAIVNGETEGAIFIDEKGELFGDKAVMHITGRETFSLHEVQKDIVDTLVMGCRVFDKSHFRTTTTVDLPEFGKKSSGMGNLTLTVSQNQQPQNGIRVSIRKENKIVGSDITTNDGSVSFRVEHATYDCVLQDRGGMITTRRVTFTDQNQKFILEL